MSSMATTTVDSRQWAPPLSVMPAQAGIQNPAGLQARERGLG